MTFSLMNQPFSIESLTYTRLFSQQPVNTAFGYDGFRSGVSSLTWSLSSNASSEFRNIVSSAISELQLFLGVNFRQTQDELEFPTNGMFNGEFLNDTSADIRISQQSDSSRIGGFTDVFAYDSDGNFDVNDIDSLVRVWTPNQYTIFHEIGHSVLLKHPSSNQIPLESPFLSAQQQNNYYTVLHYYLEGSENSVTDPSRGEWDYRHFQLFDVYALQLRFGANQATYAGSDNHTAASLGLDQWQKVLWDAGGIDTIDMSAQTRAQVINLGEGTFSKVGPVAGNNPAGINLSIAFGAKIENAIGGSGNDVLLGNSLANQLNGGLGRDAIFGYDGNDFLSDGGGGLGSEDELVGGFGDDVYVISVRGSSTLEYVGQGIDEVRTTFSIYGLQAHIENLTFIDNSQHGAGVGNILDNIITGGTGSDDLFGREGNDTLRGGNGSANSLFGQEGDDIYIVDAIGDSVIESVNQGVDTVRTALSSFTLRDNVENLTYTGIASFTGIGADNANTLRGGGGTDFLSGLGGNDIIYSGSGSDTVLGGNGADQFRFDGGETGFDRILDFTSGIDRIGLRDSGFAHTLTIDLYQSNAPLAITSNSAVLYNTSNGILSFDADGTGSGVAVVLAQLNAGLTLTTGPAGDFFLY